jgi:hypothetical protein
VIGLLGMRRVGGLLGSPLPSGGPGGTWTLLGAGTTVVAPLTEVGLATATIEHGRAAVLATPIVHEDTVPTLFAYHYTTVTNPPQINSICYSCNQLFAPPSDVFGYMCRHNAAAPKTVSWIWYKVGP